jgi:hypothetical protein
MPTPAAFRDELDEFIHSGWMGYVLRREARWFNVDGVLKFVRRSNAPVAFQEVRLALHKDFLKSPALYRTLLLSEDFDHTTLMTGVHDFGRYWTSEVSVAHEYRPRRSYQRDHPMPEVGVPYVVRINDVKPDDVDWIATVGCQLTNPELNEVRLKPGMQKIATSISRAWGFDQAVRSTPPVPGILPVPEGPGFIENFAALNGQKAQRAR